MLEPLDLRRKPVLAANYPFMDILWTMLIFFGWVIWFWLLITVFSDLFRRPDNGGWGTAGWSRLYTALPLPPARHRGRGRGRLDPAVHRAAVRRRPHLHDRSGPAHGGAQREATNRL